MPKCEIRVADAPSFRSDFSSLKRRYFQLEAAVAATFEVLENQPTAGQRIPGPYPVYKIRVRGENVGQRGGFRLIYYHVEAVVVPLFIFPKSQTEDIPRETIRRALKNCGLV